MPYRIIISRAVQKQIDKLPSDIQSRISRKKEALSLDPRPANVKKLKGTSNEYRVRIGDYRIRYLIDDANTTVEFIHCRHRKDVYRDNS